MSNPNIKLRLQVEGGGCSGFQYKFIIDESNNINNDDIVISKGDVQVLVDESSMELVKGSTIDYTQEMIKNAFVVINNPQSESACGCGSSFAVKNFASNPAID